jgi:hypothetical protein
MGKPKLKALETEVGYMQHVAVNRVIKRGNAKWKKLRNYLFQVLQ